VVALDQAQRHLLRTPAAELTFDDRRYSHAITRRRLHQPLFRARVVEAYGQRCAMCRLHHVSLLDASHILDDQHAMGQPVVPNGLALCKIQNIIGVSADLRIDVRPDILVEKDGPMLQNGLQALAGKQLTVPRDRASRPNPERLEIRYRVFSAA
jgi:putative restriction endonuclease